MVYRLDGFLISVARNWNEKGPAWKVLHGKRLFGGKNCLYYNIRAELAYSSTI